MALSVKQPVYKMKSLVQTQIGHFHTYLVRTFMFKSFLSCPNIASKSFQKNVSVFLAFDFCLFSVDIRFFLPQRPMTSDFEGFSILDFIHYIYFPILILEKEPVFPF